MNKKNNFIEQLFIVLGKKSIKCYHGKNRRELIEMRKEHNAKLRYLVALTNYEKACQDYALERTKNIPLNETGFKKMQMLYGQ